MSENPADWIWPYPLLKARPRCPARSDAGAHAFAVLASILGTARRQNQPAIPLLYALFTADISTAQAALYSNSA